MSTTVPLARRRVAEGMGMGGGPGDMGMGGFGDAEGDVAGASGHVHEPVGRAMGGREPGNHRILPNPVQPARHQIVHDVVALGDPVEDLVDAPLLLLASGNRIEAVAGLHRIRISRAAVGH